MITALYAALLSLILLGLSIQVIKYRRKHTISIGDGDIPELQQARAAHSNASEYGILCLILMAMVEYNGASVDFIHFIGIALILGRLLHAYGIMKTDFKARKHGMIITFFVLVSLIISNLIHVPYNIIFG